MIYCSRTWRGVEIICRKSCRLSSIIKTGWWLVQVRWRRLEFCWRSTRINDAVVEIDLKEKLWFALLTESWMCLSVVLPCEQEFKRWFDDQDVETSILILRVWKRVSSRMMWMRRSPAWGHMCCMQLRAEGLARYHLFPKQLDSKLMVIGLWGVCSEDDPAHWKLC